MSLPWIRRETAGFVGAASITLLRRRCLNIGALVGDLSQQCADLPQHLIVGGHLPVTLETTADRRRSMTTNHQRTKSQRLVTTTPLTSVGEELKSIKHKIRKDLFDGISVRKISKNGELANRVLTLSDDLFLLFVSHHKVGSKESIKDRFNYQGFKAYSKAVTTLTGRGVQVRTNQPVSWWCCVFVFRLTCISCFCGNPYFLGQA